MQSSTPAIPVENSKSGGVKPDSGPVGRSATVITRDENRAVPAIDRVFEISRGSTILIHMKGHQLSDGEDYPAVAIVLRVNEDSSLMLFVLDFSGQHLQPTWPQSEVIRVLVNPDHMSTMIYELSVVRAELADLKAQLGGAGKPK